MVNESGGMTLGGCWGSNGRWVEGVLGAVVNLYTPDLDKERAHCSVVAWVNEEAKIAQDASKKPRRS